MLTQKFTPDYRLIKTQDRKTMCRLKNGLLVWSIYEMTDGTIEAYQIVIPYKGAIPYMGFVMDISTARKTDWSFNSSRMTHTWNSTAVSTTPQDTSYPLTDDEIAYIKECGYIFEDDD